LDSFKLFGACGCIKILTTGVADNLLPYQFLLKSKLMTGHRQTDGHMNVTTD